MPSNETPPFLTTAVLVAALFFPTSARGQACASYIDVVDQLTTKYGEAPIALGLANNGSVVEVFASHDGAS